MRMIILALTTIGLLGLSCGDDDACSKCRPGTRPENPEQFCSPCIALDGGVD